MGLAKNSYSLPEKKMGDAARELERVWPAMAEYGIGGISVAYAKVFDGEDGEAQPLEFGRAKHAFGMDLRTFVDAFGDPEGLVASVSQAVDTVVKRWNETNGGSKNLGNRTGEEVDQPFRLRDIVQVNYRGEVKTSTLVVTASSRFANKTLMNDPEAKVEAEDMHVCLNMLKGYTGNLQRPSMSAVYIPFPAFVRLARSEEMRAAVEHGEKFLRGLESSDAETLRWSFVTGTEDPAAKGQELKTLLSAKKKNGAKRQRTD